MKLLVAVADACFYPDVMICCDERDRRAEGHWLMMETRDDLPPLTLESVGTTISTSWAFEDLAE